MDFETASAVAARIKRDRPGRIAGIAERDGKCVVLGGHNRRALNDYAGKGWAVYEQGLEQLTPYKSQAGRSARPVRRANPVSE